VPLVVLVLERILEKVAAQERIQGRVLVLAKKNLYCWNKGSYKD